MLENAFIVRQNLVKFIEAKKGKIRGGVCGFVKPQGAAKSASYEPQSSLPHAVLDSDPQQPLLSVNAANLP